MAEALLELSRICKSFPGVKALEDVHFSLYPGEVVALCGANGAGKSTMSSIVAGVYPHDAGEMKIGGKDCRFHNAKDAEEAGVGIVYQEPTLVPRMTVVENIFLGKEITRRGILDFAEMKRKAEETLASLGFSLDVTRKVSTLSLVEREATEIAKEVLLGPRILILDEVTAPLNQREVDHLFEVIRNLKKQDIGMIFISHKLNECIEISDRIIVFRDGRNVAEMPITAETTERDIIGPMLGMDARGDMHDVIADYEPPARENTLLEVQGLSNGVHFNDIDFTLYRGEIIGFAGLKGAGITELFSAIQGTIEHTAGTMRKDGKEIDPQTPAEGIANGICMVTHDRHKEGLALDQDVVSNIMIASLGSVSNGFGFVNERRMRTEASAFVDQLAIKTPTIFQLVANLSGGNQQKVVIAKWLSRKLDVLIVDEPTRGVDIKTKTEIFKLLIRHKEEGMGVLAFSPECRELLSFCDRILVVSEGRIIREVHRGAPEFTEHDLLSIIHSDHGTASDARH